LQKGSEEVLGLLGLLMGLGLFLRRHDGREHNGARAHDNLESRLLGLMSSLLRERGRGLSITWINLIDYYTRFIDSL
jgi:hypothetical protein